MNQMDFPTLCPERSCMEKQARGKAMRMILSFFLFIQWLCHIGYILVIKILMFCLSEVNGNELTSIGVGSSKRALRS